MLPVSQDRVQGREGDARRQRRGTETPLQGLEGQRIHRHAAVHPQGPGDSDGRFAARQRPPAAARGGEGVHEGIGCCIVGLAGVAKGGGDGRAQQEEIQGQVTGGNI